MIRRLLLVALFALGAIAPATAQTFDPGALPRYPASQPAACLYSSSLSSALSASGLWTLRCDPYGRLIGGRNTTRTLLLSGTYTATTTGGTATVGWATECSIATNVTAASGTSPTLAVTVDASLDGGTTWVLGIATGANITAVGTQWFTVGAGTQNNNGFGDTLRIRAVIGGTTPSFSVSVFSLCK